MVFSIESPLAKMKHRRRNETIHKQIRSWQSSNMMLERTKIVDSSVDGPVAQWALGDRISFYVENLKMAELSRPYVVLSLSA